MDKDRSQHVFDALKKMPNRFQLCRTAAKGARALHPRNARIEDTTNLALRFVAQNKA